MGPICFRVGERVELRFCNCLQEQLSCQEKQGSIEAKFKGFGSAREMRSTITHEAVARNGQV